MSKMYKGLKHQRCQIDIALHCLHDVFSSISMTLPEIAQHCSPTPRAQTQPSPIYPNLETLGRIIMPSGLVLGMAFILKWLNCHYGFHIASLIWNFQPQVIHVVDLIDVMFWFLQVVVMQEYTNDNNAPIEAKYVFPLNDMAAVCGFEAFINGKHIIGECISAHCDCCLSSKSTTI